MSERRNRQMRDVASRTDRRVYKTAAATLTLDETLVICDTTDGAMAITLPNVSEAAGLMFSIVLQTDGGDLTIQDDGDSYAWDDRVFDNAGDREVLYSDGYAWHVMASDLT